MTFIEDRDLWTFAFEDDTRAFSAGLNAYPFSFAKMEEIHQGLLKDGLSSQFMREARAMYRLYVQKVETIAAKARWDHVAGYEVIVVNSPYEFVSEVCHFLLDKYPESSFVAGYSDETVVRRWSLRGRDEGLAVNKIAQALGGGGHRNAAGFSRSIPPINL